MEIFEQYQHFSTTFLAAASQGQKTVSGL